MSPSVETDALAARLRPLYARFLGARSGEILLTGHSHQAWPDVSREAQLEAWDDAARLVDAKWDRVFGEILPAFRTQVARRLGTERAQDLTVAPNTHELVYRLASCFPLDAKVLTTDQEFHSLRRQLDRLEEEGTRVTRVAVTPETDPEGTDFGARFMGALRHERPAWAALSLVFFTNARIVRELPEILGVAAELGVPLLIDAYHAFNVLPMQVDDWPGQVFVTAGGYKYAESGEGACFMLLPASADEYRPRSTGWFSDFAHLASGDRTVRYGAGGARFFGSTFDPTPFYRALRTFEHMEREGLSVEVLRAQSRRQTQQLVTGAEERGLEARGVRLASPRAEEARAGFVAFEVSEAERWVRELRARGIHTDARGSLLRLGPAPYLMAEELERALEAMETIAREYGGG